MDLVVRDTLSGRRRAVRHRRGRPLALYVCGPTVYDVAHVGHARTYLYFDVARRFLEAEGVPVRHVMNLTDFEDKLEVRATELGLSWRALARREERGFFRDLADLGVRTPHVRPRASDFIGPMIRVARRLERTGRVRRDGDEWIYTPPPRAARANFPTDRQLASHAVTEPGHPFPAAQGTAGEFTVWKRQDSPKPSWPSPWGRGVPGWHLECYAMAERFLGLPVDLHGGAPDLIYPHHYAENEVALELRGAPFSRVFLHTAFVLTSGTKMSKSKGNLVSLRSALDAVGAGPLRWYLLGTPYGRRLEWDPGALARAVAEYAAIRATVGEWVGRTAGGRGTAASVHRLSEGIRADLAHGLATDRAFGRLRA
ncbi:MAG: class I tRNA ligase family protein, partial [Thermoplasmata archaeon]